MSNKQKMNVIFVFLVIFLSLLLIHFAFPKEINVINSQHNKIDTDDNKEKSLIPSASYILTSPIDIDNTDPNKNWSKTAAENAWCTGSGTWVDPYLIEDVMVIGNQTGFNLITIRNSDVDFKIINCEIFNGSYPGDGIVLYNVTNGILIDNDIFECRRGIELYSCNDIIISGNTLFNLSHGIWYYE
ncbi:MAG: right-handed parallel beta-helix repeat-containing protein, partial [Candidatus Hodarchaeota archaeon]